MVCNRCIMAVDQVLKNLGISYVRIELGEVELPGELLAEKYHQLNNKLISLGFELIDNRKSRMIEKIKNTIIELVYHCDGNPGVNFSGYLTSKIHYEYNYLSTLFSEIEGTTIEKYFITQKIERVKELLVYDELTLSQIAYKLGYSSTAYLSNQFKKVTGLTPGHFKKVKENKRKPIDQL